MKNTSYKNNGYVVFASSLSAAALVVMSAAQAANVVVPSGYDLIVTAGNGHVNGSLDVGNGNTTGDLAPCLIVGLNNSIAPGSAGVVLGYGNTLEDSLDDSSSYGTLINGDSNIVLSNYSFINGQGNVLTEDFGWASQGNLLSGYQNQMENHSYALVAGYRNSLTAPGAISSQHGWYAAAIGGFIELDADTGWAMGLNHQITGVASTTLGWGLVNPVHSSVMLGTFNASVTGNATAYAESNPAFVLGNGSTTVRSNAIVTLKNGETTLKNKAWDPQEPLVAPATADMAAGRALVVEGHTLLKGRVVIAEPQGDISMGIYGD